MSAADNSAGAKIAKVCGREILDSRGMPTVEAEVHLACGIRAFAAAPSGASVGGGEAVELRDKEKRLQGKGVRRAAANLNSEIADALCGADCRDYESVDNLLIAADNSADKSRLGANAILAASLAAAKAGAKFCARPFYEFLGDGCTMPVPFMNIINGGAHADNNLDIQEFMIAPIGFDDFPSALFAGAEVFHSLKKLLARQKLSTAVGDEGGFAPDLHNAEKALELVCEAIISAGFAPGKQIAIALDVAAGELHHNGAYHLPGENFRGDANALVEKFSDWHKKYPIASIEDGCAEEDWDGWRLLTDCLGDKMQLVGDDLFATNCVRLQKGIDRRAANALLAKPNQIGTLTETRDAVRLAQNAGYGVMMSHRSGETEYADLADIAVAWNAGQIKSGAPCRGERTAKYNRLLRIAEALGGAAKYAGQSVLKCRS